MTAIAELPKTQGFYGAAREWFQPILFPRRGELWVALVLVPILYILEKNFGLFWRFINAYQHLGAEYYNIAEALVDGRGFSDPFGEISGPTAWMPPLYPAFLAVLLAVLEEKVLVAHTIVWVTIAALTVVGVLLYRIANSRWRRLPPTLIVPLYLIWLWAFYYWFFFLTHDIWLLTLLVTCIVYSLHRYEQERRLRRWQWGLLGGVSALTSPSVAVAWFAVSVFLFVRSHSERRSLVLAAALAVCMNAPWVARNAVDFHRFIPTKSNLFYEAYAGNYRTPAGIYDNTWDEHPYNSARARFEYARAGEMKYLDAYRTKFFSALAEDPMRYVNNVVNRAVAVTLVHPFQAGMFDSPAKKVIRDFILVLPFFSFVFLLMSRTPAGPFVNLLAMLWASYLVPYVLVAFYMRYLMPLTSCLVIVWFLAADHLLSTTLARLRVLQPAR